MRTPIKPLPVDIERWTRRAWWLRWLDALVAWLILWAGVAMLLPDLTGGAQATIAAVIVGAAAAIAPLRVRWRPMSGWVALVVSRPLRPGDRAWLVRAGEAELVVVTARRGFRLVIARARDPEEGVAVRRTRVLLLPADSR